MVAARRERGGVRRYRPRGVGQEVTPGESGDGGGVGQEVTTNQVHHQSISNSKVCSDMGRCNEPNVHLCADHAESGTTTVCGRYGNGVPAGTLWIA